MSWEPYVVEKTSGIPGSPVYHLEITPEYLRSTGGPKASLDVGKKMQEVLQLCFDGRHGWWDPDQLANCRFHVVLTVEKPE